MIDQLYDIAFSALDRRHANGSPRTAVSSAIPEEKGPQQPLCRYPDLVERPASSSPASPTAGTAGVGDFSAQYRARIYGYERLIDRLYDLAHAERFDDLTCLVTDEYRAIHGR